MRCIRCHSRSHKEVAKIGVLTFMSEINFDSIHVEDTVWSSDLHVCVSPVSFDFSRRGHSRQESPGIQIFNLGFILLRVAFQDTM